MLLTAVYCLAASSDAAEAYTPAAEVTVPAPLPAASVADAAYSPAALAMLSSPRVKPRRTRREMVYMDIWYMYAATATSTGKT